MQESGSMKVFKLVTKTAGCGFLFGEDMKL